MKQTIEINGKAFTIEQLNELIANSQKEITEKSTFQDVLNYLGSSDKEVVEYNKLVNANITSKALYFQMAVCLVRALNQKHELDWNNKNEYKYYIWWYMNEFLFYYGCCHFEPASVSAALCFKRESDMKDAVDKFLPEYKESRLSSNK